MTSTLKAEPRTSCSYYVALEDNGVPKFSPNPVPHPTHGAAAKEAERLARAHPGLVFGIYSRPTGATMLPMVFTLPKERTVFTGAELAEGKAPEGRYRCTTYRTGAVFVVLKSGAASAALLISPGGSLAPLDRASWSADKFELVNKNAKLILQ